MKDGIKIEIDWWDADVTILVIKASNGLFRGQVRAYASPDQLSEIAKSLRGFPTGMADRRNFEVGAFRPAHAGGGIQMRFHCLDAAGHAAVDVKLRSAECEAFGELESAAFRILVEAAGIDSFIEQIQSLERAQGSSACLPMAT